MPPRRQSRARRVARIDKKQRLDPVAAKFQGHQLNAPTGIVVRMREERSQHKNRDKAWRVLRARVFEHFDSQRRAQRSAMRRTMIGSGDRNERIRTYNFPQNRCTDHRLNENFPLEKIVAGDLSDLGAALQDFDRKERLAQLASS